MDDSKFSSGFIGSKELNQCELNDEGKSLREIGRLVGGHYFTILKAVTRLRDNVIDEKVTRTGRKRFLDCRSDRIGPIFNNGNDLGMYLNGKR
ncbi:hypothetical protein A3Q56_07490 [Intoshia linei]|uniref:Uncharacterized protein n=1 Tax=Intoshia linei TaxID=1819745 RepID=A0A177ARY5_9BILA|nr:hypothetical protein A3Q56_07490 [Intoshia linei]